MLTREAERKGVSLETVIDTLVRKNLPAGPSKQLEGKTILNRTYKEKVVVQKILYFVDELS